jgi:cytochrome c553
MSFTVGKSGRGLLVAIAAAVVVAGATLESAFLNPQANANIPVALPAGDVAFGEYLAGECVTCHQVDGSDRGIPPIVGWEPMQFVAVMHSYRDKVRDNAVMQTIAGRYGDAEVAALAAYFATLQPK